MRLTGKPSKKRRGAGYLTNEEERNLAITYLNYVKQVKHDCEEAKDVLLKLIDSTIDYIYRKAYQYHSAYTRSFSQSEGGSVLQFDDVVMEGVIGYIIAAIQYNPEHHSNSTLLTYARQSIKASILSALQEAYGAPRYAFDQSGFYSDSPAYQEWRVILKQGGALPFSFLRAAYENESDNSDDSWEFGSRAIFEDQEFSIETYEERFDLDLFKALLAQFLEGFPDLRKVKKPFRVEARRIRGILRARTTHEQDKKIFCLRFGLGEDTKTVKEISELYKISAAKIKDITSFYLNLLKSLLNNSNFVY